MPLYSYDCSGCGMFDSFERGDSLIHTCGKPARRVWRLKIDATSARHKGRFDHVVGAYVESEREFRSLFREGQDRESASLGRDVKLATIDARDTEGLAELHGHSVAEHVETKAKSDFVKKARKAK